MDCYFLFHPEYKLNKEDLEKGGDGKVKMCILMDKVDVINVKNALKKLKEQKTISMFSTGEEVIKNGRQSYI